MIDAPRRAVRPVHSDAITYLAAEQLVAGHAQPFGLGIDQRVFDGPHRLRHHAAGTWPRDAIELRVNALMLADGLPHHARRQVRDHGADSRRAEAFVELAPADDAAVGREFDKVIVAPSRVAGERLDARHFHCCFLRLFRMTHTICAASHRALHAARDFPLRYSRERASAVSGNDGHGSISTCTHSARG